MTLGCVLGKVWCLVSCFFQAEDGIRDLVRSRGLGDVYKRQAVHHERDDEPAAARADAPHAGLRVVLDGAEPSRHLSLIHI